MAICAGYWSKAYLSQTGQSANSYIKGLIKADLDGKGFTVDNWRCLEFMWLYEAYTALYGYYMLDTLQLE